MKKKYLFFLLLIIPFTSKAQFEEKVSLTISPGIFKTFGKKMGQYDPMQMSNYQMGFSANGGLQFKINERIFLSSEFGIMISQRWSYSEGDNNNYLYWSINDTLTGNLISEGEDYLDIYNYSFGIKPKYYLQPGKKLNPYLFLGVNLNWTRAYFENNLWAELDKLDMLPADDEGPYNDNLETNFGIGFNPGIGVEYNIKDKFGLFLSSGYYFIKLKKDNFKSPSREENFNAFVLQAGLRFYFIKSKDL